MSSNYFLKKKILNILTKPVLFLLRALVGIYKFFFAKRTILFVSDNKIRTIHLGTISQAVLLAFVIFVGDVFIKSLRYSELINTKSQEISRLKSVNHYFENEFGHMNDKLKKVNEYLISITGSKQQASSIEQKFQKPKNLRDEDLTRSDKNTLNEVKDATFALNRIQEIARLRIKNIEDAISDTGLNLKKMPNNTNYNLARTSEREISLNKKGDLTKGQGGPLLDEEMDNFKTSESEDELEKELEKAQFSNEFDRLFLLEKLVSVMPLSRPIKHYYISSGFGVRSDPITHGRGVHKGLDFVGPKNEDIISPASGKVILAGRYSAYGKAIVIDHGFGITTRYGHLSAVNVKKGDIVTKGQIIASQGSTGRSTGQHLHYEVRYKGTPLDPKKFLEAGDSLLSDEQTTNYVNS
jgi:murein DD-endopeptidase MepM/ murein hydrolase activator NlpD